MCLRCYGTGIVETGNNDLPCDCKMGNRALFNEAGVGPVTGAEIKKHYYNDSPEPLDGVPSRGDVLVVDDDDPNREYVAEILRSAGFKVTTAREGAEGLRNYHDRDDRFAIIISDWSMPRMMGTEMVRKIRRHDDEQKILMMSSEPEMVRKELLSLHIADVKVLFKSFTPEQFVREVLHVIQGDECEFAK